VMVMSFPPILQCVTIIFSIKLLEHLQDLVILGLVLKSIIDKHRRRFFTRILNGLRRTMNSIFRSWRLSECINYGVESHYIWLDSFLYPPWFGSGYFYRVIFKAETVIFLREKLCPLE